MVVKGRHHRYPERGDLEQTSSLAKTANRWTSPNLDQGGFAPAALAVKIKKEKDHFHEIHNYFSSNID